MESSKRQDRSNKFIKELDHQDPSLKLGPTFKAPGIVANFHVPKIGSPIAKLSTNISL